VMPPWWLRIGGDVHAVEVAVGIEGAPVVIAGSHTKPWPGWWWVFPLRHCASRQHRESRYAGEFRSVAQRVTKGPLVCARIVAGPKCRPPMVAPPVKGLWPVSVKVPAPIWTDPGCPRWARRWWR
jgi:hypothetical protein